MTELLLINVFLLILGGLAFFADRSRDDAE